jgi:hypothetical protein
MLVATSQKPGGDAERTTQARAKQSRKSKRTRRDRNATLWTIWPSTLAAALAASASPAGYIPKSASPATRRRTRLGHGPASIDTPCHQISSNFSPPGRRRTSPRHTTNNHPHLRYSLINLAQWPKAHEQAARRRTAPSFAPTYSAP